MKIYRSIIALLVLILPMASPASGAPKQIFKPTGPWAMDYADQACRLIRNFSDGTGEVTLALERRELGVALTLGFAGKALRAHRDIMMAKFRYTGEKTEQVSALLQTVLTDGRDGLLVADAPLLSREKRRKIFQKNKLPALLAALESAETAQAERITSISFSYGFFGNPEFELGSMAAPMQAMRTCVQDLVKGWGVDPKRMATMSRPPEPIERPRSWLSMDDYPDEMWRKGKDGVVPVRLVIDEMGVVKDCLVIVEKAGPFEEAVCKGIQKRAHFKPALDADGKPMRSYWNQVVRFVS